MRAERLYHRQFLQTGTADIQRFRFGDHHRFIAEEYVAAADLPYSLRETRLYDDERGTMTLVWRWQLSDQEFLSRQSRQSPKVHNDIYYQLKAI